MNKAKAARQEELRRKQARRYLGLATEQQVGASADRATPPVASQSLSRVAARDEETRRAVAAAGYDLHTLHRSLGNAAVGDLLSDPAERGEALRRSTALESRVLSRFVEEDFGWEGEWADEPVADEGAWADDAASWQLLEEVTADLLAAEPGPVAGGRVAVHDAVAGLDVIYDLSGGAPDVDLGQIKTSLGGGQAMDPETREYMEWRFGVSFDRVRFHVDSKADAVSKAIFARAFALGADVAFQRGELRPGTTAGDRLLAHELMHVVQAGLAPRMDVSLHKSSSVSEPTDSFEVEADAVADRVVAISRAEFRQARAKLLSGEPLTDAERERWRSVVGRRRPTEAEREAPRQGDLRARLAALVAEGGRPLDTASRQRLEASFGRSLAHVRVHDDPAAAALVAELGAKAVTVDDHVLFGDPAGAGSLGLLAHEVAHTLQGGPGFEPEGSGALVGSPTSAAEVEAAAAASGAVAGRPVEVRQAGAAAVAASSEPGGGATEQAKAPGSVQVMHGTTHAGTAKIVRQGNGFAVQHGEPLDTTKRWTHKNEAGVTFWEGKVGGRPLAHDEVFNADGTLKAEWHAMNAEAGAKASGVFSGGEYKVAAEASASLKLVGGSLVAQTPELEFTILGEKVKAQVGVKASADVLIEAKGEVALALDTVGQEVKATAGGEAFAGAKAGVVAFASLKWQPQLIKNWLDVAAASYGAEGWAGAGVVFESKLSLYPSIGVEFSAGIGLGLGGGMRGKIEVHGPNSATLLLVLGGRALADGLNAIGLENFGRALDRLLTDLHKDDAARQVWRNAVQSGLHSQLPFEQRLSLVEAMLAGVAGDEDEDCILEIFRATHARGELATMVDRIEGSTLTLIDKFHGQQYSDLLELFYVNSVLTDPLLNDDLARKLVSLGKHKAMTVREVRRVVEAMLEGATGDEDEQAILTIVRDRSDVTTVFNQHLVQRTMEDFHGEEYDALVGFYYLKDMVPSADVDDDVARAVIHYDLHKGVATGKLDVLFDAMISGHTGDADEQAIVKLLKDRQDYAAALTEDRLKDALSDVDGDEYDELIVALRAGRAQMDLADKAYKVDDDIARVATAAGLHKQLRTAELIFLKDQLVQGATGDDDELAILAILNDNRGRVEQILPDTASRKELLGELDGEEHDSLLGLYAVKKLLPGIRVDDDVVRGIVRLGLHKDIADGPTLWGYLEQLAKGFTGDDDEQAILSILDDCPAARGEVQGNEARLKRLVDVIDGEEYSQFVARGRKSGLLPDLTKDWLPVSDDEARAVVDAVSLSSLSAAEVLRLLKALERGWTGGADEQRILTLLRTRPEAAKSLDEKVRDSIIASVDGDNRTELFVLLYEQGALADPTGHKKFDDDAARAYVDKGFHKQLGRGPVRALAQHMVDGFTGDADELKLIALVSDRPDVFSKVGDKLLSDIIENTHGEEELTLFETLLDRTLLNTRELHGDFDDDVVRYFVSKGLHKNAAFDTSARQELLRRLMKGVAGNADEQTMLTLLRDDADLAKGLPDKLRAEVVDHTQGAEEAELFALLYQAGHGKWVLEHDSFDDDAARLFVDKGLHTGMAVTGAKVLADRMLDGHLSEDDEGRLLTLLADKSALANTFSWEQLRLILNRFDGEEQGKLVVTLYKQVRAKLKLTDAQLFLSDDSARAMVDAGQHKTMSGEELYRLVDVMLVGFTGDADEDRILILVRDQWSKLHPKLGEAGLKRVLSAVDGEQHDRLLGLLWDLGGLPRGQRLTDSVARGIVAEGRFHGKPQDKRQELLDTLSGGRVGDADERAIIDLLRADAALMSAQGASKLVDLLGSINGDERDEYLGLLLERKVIAIDSEHLDDDAVRYVVTSGLLAKLKPTAAQKGGLIGKLLDGFTSDDDQAAVLGLLGSDPSSVGAMLKDYPLATLMSNFELDRRQQLTTLLYKNNHQRKDLLTNHVDAAMASWLAKQNLSMPPDHLAILLGVLLADGGSRSGRGAWDLLRSNAGSIPTLLPVARVSEVREKFPEAEVAEIVTLLYQQHAATYPKLLEDLQGTTAVKMARMKLYDSMTTQHRLQLLTALTLRGGAAGAVGAVELVEQLASNTSALQALITAAGGREDLLNLFTGAHRKDVDAVLAGLNLGATTP